MVAFNGKRRLDGKQFAMLTRLVEELTQRVGTENLVFNNKYAEALKAMGFADSLMRNRVSALPDNCDLVVSVGGDGTFIKTARWVGRREVPVLGINGGHLGYLSDTDLAGVNDFIDGIAFGNLSFEARTMLYVKIENLWYENTIYPYALNEVAVLRDDTASMINIDAKLNGRELARYPADGLIVCTPTGSTAYNLSVGGPVVAPETPALVIAPVAPHALTMRPIVVPDTGIISLNVSSRAETFRLALDGRSISLPLSAALEIRKADFRTIIARLTDTDFAHTLRTKLLWGVDPR